MKPLSDQYTAAEGKAKLALSDAVDQVEKDFDALLTPTASPSQPSSMPPGSTLQPMPPSCAPWVETDYEDMEDAAEVIKIIAVDPERFSQQREA